MPAVKKILYAVELSSISPKIVPWVKTLMEQFQAELHVMHVVPDFEYIGGLYSNAHMLAQGNEGLARKAKEKVDFFCLDHFGVEVKPQTYVTVGIPAEEIVAYAQENQMDVVIVGSHGKRGLERAFFGSVADEVLRNCPVPVFCVNPTAQTV